MDSLSYIVNGDGLNSSGLDQLERYINNVKASCTEHAEIILYFLHEPTLDPVPGVSFIASRSKQISSLEKAIAVARGDRLIFTTYANILADTLLYMAHSALKIPTCPFAMPNKRGRVARIIGIRRTSNVGYIIMSKGFAASNARALTEPIRAVYKATRDLSLFVFTPPSNPMPERVLPDRLVFRPNFIILRCLFYIRRQKWRDYRARRRAEKLRNQVLPAPYNMNIPVFIICRDRLEPLKKLIKWCEDESLKNIYLIDNASTYLPLLEYYKSTPHEVIRLDRNVGHISPWSTGIVDIYAPGIPFIISDPDVIPSPQSHGAVKFFAHLLNKYPERRKVGFGLRIDNIPNHYTLKEHVVAWEKQFWVSKVERDVYDAEIDTTFALYRPKTPYVLGPALRTGGKYVAMHEPWYLDSAKVNDEVKYYRSHANTMVGTWGVDINDVSDTYKKHKHNLKGNS